MGVELLIAVAAAAATAYNTNQTAKKQDRALATDIRNQGAKRREGEALTNAEIEKLQASTSADERQKKLADYTASLRKHGGEATNGLSNGIGGETFTADAATGAQDVMDYGMDNASLMSRIDAPIDQRIGESTSFGNLGIDLDTVAREAQGRHFLDQLRVQGIRRNPWIDAGAQVLGGASSAMGGGGMTGASSAMNSGMPSLSDYTGAMSNSGASGFGFGGLAKNGKIVGLPPI